VKSSKTGGSITTQSGAAKLLDDELAAWRNRPLGEIKYLILDARYESEARGLRGVQYVVSDDHAGLRAARRAVFGGATWQRCQFHLAQNAIHHAPNLAIRKRVGAELREIWNAASLAKAETALTELIADYRDTAPKLAAWLEENVPEGLAVFTLPKHHRRRMRTSSPMERSVQQELKRRTVKLRVFPNEAALERLVGAVLVEIDDKWAADTKAYIKWECQHA
jgi:putative transposase